jgi:hypothetical protein
MSDVEFEDDAPRQTNSQRFAQRARQNDIGLALRAAAQLFVTANNASWPKLTLDCIDPHCDNAYAFIANVWQDSVCKLLEQESSEFGSTNKEFNLVKARIRKYLRKLFPRSLLVFVARDEGGVMGDAVPAFLAEGMDIDNDGSESGSSASDGRGAAGRAPAVTSAPILVNSWTRTY